MRKDVRELFEAKTAVIERPKTHLASIALVTVLFTALMMEVNARNEAAVRKLFQYNVAIIVNDASNGLALPETTFEFPSPQSSIVKRGYRYPCFSKLNSENGRVIRTISGIAEGPFEFTVRKPGYQHKTVTIGPDTDDEIIVELQPNPEEVVEEREPE